MGGEMRGECGTVGPCVRDWAGRLELVCDIEEESGQRILPRVPRVRERGEHEEGQREVRAVEDVVAAATDGRQCGGGGDDAEQRERLHHGYDPRPDRGARHVSDVRDGVEVRPKQLRRAVGSMHSGARGLASTGVCGGRWRVWRRQRTPLAPHSPISRPTWHAIATNAAPPTHRCHPNAASQERPKAAAADVCLPTGSVARPSSKLSVWPAAEPSFPRIVATDGSPCTMPSPIDSAFRSTRSASGASPTEKCLSSFRHPSAERACS